MLKDGGIYYSHGKNFRKFFAYPCLLDPNTSKYTAVPIRRLPDINAIFSRPKGTAWGKERV